MDSLTLTTLEDYGRHLLAEGMTQTTISTRARVVLAVTRGARLTDPARLRQPHVLGFLAARELAPASRDAYLRHLAAWGHWIGQDDLTSGIRRPRIPQGVPRPITEAQLARLMLASVHGSEERAWVVLGAMCGLRSFETAKVAGADVEQHVDGWALRVLGKGGKTAVVPMPLAAVDELEPWISLSSGGRFWPHASARLVQARIKALGRRAGVDLTSHQLRHRYGTQLYRSSGRSLLDTQAGMRHSSPQTTAGYALLDAASLRGAVERLPLPGHDSKTVGGAGHAGVIGLQAARTE